MVQDLPNEIWKDIKGYEGWYQISNKGRVKRLSFTRIMVDGRKRPFTEMLIKPYERKDKWTK